MRNTKWMVLCLFIGFLLAAGMMSTIPIYMDASLQRMLIKDMDRRGVIISAAWYTNAICIITAHYAYTQSIDPRMIAPMMAAKLTGGILAVILACIMAGNYKKVKEEC